MLNKDKKLLYFSALIFVATQNVRQRIILFQVLQNIKYVLVFPQTWQKKEVE